MLFPLYAVCEGFICFCSGVYMKDMPRYAVGKSSGCPALFRPAGYRTQLARGFEQLLRNRLAAHYAGKLIGALFLTE